MILLGLKCKSLKSDLVDVWEWNGKEARILETHFLSTNKQNVVWEQRCCGHCNKHCKRLHSDTAM